MKIIILLFFSLYCNVEASIYDDFIIKLKSDKASKMLLEGNYDEAEKLYREALNINTNSTEIYNNMGITLLSLGEKDTAIETFELAKKTLKKNTKNDVKNSVYYNSGIAKIEAKRYKESVLDLVNSLYYNPDDDKSREALEYARNKIDEENRGGDDKSDDLDNNSSPNDLSDTKEEIDKNDIDKLLESLRRLRKESKNKEEYYSGESFEKDW